MAVSSLTSIGLRPTGPVDNEGTGIRVTLLTASWRSTMQPRMVPDRHLESHARQDVAFSIQSMGDSLGGIGDLNPIVIAQGHPNGHLSIFYRDRILVDRM